VRRIRFDVLQEIDDSPFTDTLNFEPAGLADVETVPFREESTKLPGPEKSPLPSPTNDPVAPVNAPVPPVT